MLSYHSFITLPAPPHSTTLRAGSYFKGGNLLQPITSTLISKNKNPSTNLHPRRYFLDIFESEDRITQGNTPMLVVDAG